LNTFLKVIAIILILLGILICSMGTPYQGDMFHFGPYEKIHESEGRRLTRFAIVGIAFVAAGAGILKFGVVPE